MKCNNPASLTNAEPLISLKMEVPTDSVPVIMDLEDPVICDLASEFVHGLLEFWFGDLHNLDEIPQEKYEM